MIRGWKSGPTHHRNLKPREAKEGGGFGVPAHSHGILGGWCDCRGCGWDLFGEWMGDHYSTSIAAEPLVGYPTKRRIYEPTTRNPQKILPAQRTTHPSTLDDPCSKPQLQLSL